MMGAPLPRSHVPSDRLGEDLGAGSRPDVAFETELLTRAGNLTPLPTINRELIEWPDAMASLSG